MQRWVLTISHAGEFESQHAESTCILGPLVEVSLLHIQAGMS